MEEIGTPKVLAVIQARMGSSRLPGKMLLPIIDNKGALELMLERVSRAGKLDKIVVATTKSSDDDPLADRCRHLGYECFRGSEDDVLDRYYQTILAFAPVETIVRLTSDCPLHDPMVIDKVVSCFLDSDADYVSNANPPTYPDGLDTEMFSVAALERTWHEAKLQSEREHVTSYIYNHPNLFRIVNVENEKDLSNKRWVLDEKEDYEFIRCIFENLYKKNPLFGMREILELLVENPEFEQINKHISRNEGYQMSLEKDKVLDPGFKGEC